MKPYILIFLLLFTGSALSSSILMEDFESGVIPIVKPDAPTTDKKYLWNQYPNDFTEGPDLGVASITEEDAYSGKKSLVVEVTEGNVYFQFYPSDQTGWSYMKEFIDGWENDKYYKLSFWVKLPEGITKTGGGRKNATFGTYIRATTSPRSNAESGGAGGHFYHNFDIESTGRWQQIIIDMHPNHERGESGSKEHNYIPYRTEEPGYNYFDTMTRFYFEIDRRLPSDAYPAKFYFDRFELIDDADGENYDQVGSVTGVYNASMGRFSLNWRRKKTEKFPVHEIRYSTQSIHQIGWDNATEAPNGSVTGRGDDYDGMEYLTSDIGVNNQDLFYYFAIKPVGSASFREIKIPIPLNRPKSPTDISIN